jgi:hypothetical protein
MEQDDFSSQIPIPPEEVAKSISSGLPAIDAVRAGGLGQLGQLRDAKARSLSREQRLLALKHGDRPHSRRPEAQQRFAANEHFRREIAVVREVAETPAPEPARDAMIVHGFVRQRRDHTGIPGLTVALTDAEGSWIRESGYACTDQRGYFRLDLAARGEGEPGHGEPTPDIKPPAGISVEDARREAGAKAAAGRAEAAEGRAQEPGRRSAALRVFDSRGRLLHVEQRPVALRAGRVDYRYILLGDDAAHAACTPPPQKSGGRPAPVTPRPPADTPAPPPARPPETPPPAPPRVTDLKAYEEPAAAPRPAGDAPPSSARTSTPLEAIRGIGPKRAEELRQAGIRDVEQYQRTRGAAFVKVAGFDKGAPQPPEPEPKRGRRPPEKKAPEEKTTRRKPAAKKKREK